MAILKVTLSILVVIMSFTALSAQVTDSTWFRPNQLINHPMPPVTGTTISGTAVNPVFFKDNVVLLAFGNLQNVASLKEIELLNQSQRDFSGHPFKVLGVLPNSKQDVKDFNDPSPDNNGDAHNLRLSFKIPLMEFPVMATCEQRNVNDNTLRPACDNIVKDYLIQGYPVICLVDKNGIIRYVHVNLPSPDKQQEWYNSLMQEIDILLKEK